ncbi:hypothetical protein IAD21_03242 [Abditibacteriota bacterium]|nr:hypothetical protein IAD21_03242 [Abditibacteriota bacterium]
MKIQRIDARPEPDFERGHLSNAVSLAPDAVLIWAERELPTKIVPLQVYGTQNGDERALATKTELEKLGFINVELLPFGWIDRPAEEKTEVGPARWEILGCGG